MSNAITPLAQSKIFAHLNTFVSQGPLYPFLPQRYGRVVLDNYVGLGSKFYVRSNNKPVASVFDAVDEMSTLPVSDPRFNAIASQYEGVVSKVIGIPIAIPRGILDAEGNGYEEWLLNEVVPKLPEALNIKLKSLIHEILANPTNAIETVHVDEAAMDFDAMQDASGYMADHNIQTNDLNGFISGPAIRAIKSQGINLSNVQPTDEIFAKAKIYEVADVKTHQSSISELAAAKALNNKYFGSVVAEGAVNLVVVPTATTAHERDNARVTTITTNEGFGLKCKSFYSPAAKCDILFLEALVGVAIGDISHAVRFVSPTEDTTPDPEDEI